MSGRSQRDVGKERFWREMVQRWRSSAQTVRAFCAQQGLSEPGFYSWRRTIAARDAARTATVPVRKAPVHALPAFVPIRVAATPPPRPTLEVVVGSGRVIRVPPDFDATTLRNLLLVLEEASSC